MSMALPHPALCWDALPGGSHRGGKDPLHLCPVDTPSAIPATQILPGVSLSIDLTASVQVSTASACDVNEDAAGILCILLPNREKRQQTSHASFSQTGKGQQMQPHSKAAGWEMCGAHGSNDLLGGVDRTSWRRSRSIRMQRWGLRQARSGQGGLCCLSASARL